MDSEDEADYTHMDSKLGKSRTEFNTEEEWQVRAAWEHPIQLDSPGFDLMSMRI